MSAQNDPLTPLTRKELYSLSEKCRDVAFDLARQDQHRVSLKHCHEFNRWLPELKSYDLLAPGLTDLKAARPIARWQVMIISAVLILFLMVALPISQARSIRMFTLAISSLLLLGIYFIPERIYGTTIELVEGKVLYIVDQLDKQLSSGVLEFSEAAFHRVKQNLNEARSELRQQIDLAYRARSRQPFF